MKDPYVVLGLTEEATEEQLTERYESLRAKYKEERFQSGEAGNIAAKNLTELEEAWAVISQRLKQSRFESDFAYIDGLIKDKKYDDAQKALDAIVDRTAQWHYYQSKVYYYREWLTESRKQLRVALDMDPNNEKYKLALEKMDMVMGNSKANQSEIHGDDIDAARANSESARNQEQMAAGNALSNCCTAYCCTSLCCDAMSCCCR